MFGKKECKNCENKVSTKYKFCPYCGNSFGEKTRKDENLGMLGKDDSFENNIEEEFNRLTKSMFGGIGGSVINRMIGNAMKVMEKEMEKEMKKKNYQPKTNFQLFINGKKANLDNFNDLNIPIQEKRIKRKVREIPSNRLPQRILKDFSALPREEPSTNVRRFSNKVVYEVNMPGVRSLKDVSITKLENAIEIKAISDKKSYFKIIPINLPITNYGVSRGKLLLELGING